MTLRAAACLAFLLAACATHDDSRTLAERLQGNWFYNRVYPDQGFIRTDYASLAVHVTTIQYSATSSWDCDTVGTCPGTPPEPRGGSFEGIFTDLGDSLAVRDGTDTLSFQSVTDSSFTFIVNGISFPMRRN